MVSARNVLKDEWARWFLLLGAIFGVAFALFLPPLSGIDETAHYLRVNTIADGWIVAPPAHETPSDYQIDGCDAAFVSASKWSVLDMTSRALPTRRVPWTSQFHNPTCIAAAPARSVNDGLLRRAEPYAPVSYLPALAGFEVGSHLAGSAGGFYAARLVQLASYLVLVAAAIALIPFGKPLLLAAGLIPINLQNAATISADPLTIATALLLGALVCHASVRARAGRAVLGRKYLAILALLAVLIGLLKTPYAPLALMVVFVPTTAYGTVRRKVAFVAGTLGSAVLVVFGWSLTVKSGIDMPPLGEAGQLGTLDAQRWIGDHPWHFLHLVVAQFTTSGSLHRFVATGYVPIHTDALARIPFGQLLIVICVAVLVLVRVLDPRTTGRGDPRRLLGAVAIAGASVFLISYGMALSGLLSPTALGGFQGRYLFPLVPLSLVAVDPARVRKSRKSQLRWVPGWSVSMLGIWCLVTWKAFHPLM